MTSIWASGAVILIILSSLNFAFGMTLMEKHKTMKVVMCNCTDEKHETKPIAEFNSQDFVATGYGNDLGGVAVSEMILENALKKCLDKEKEPHYILKYNETDGYGEYRLRKDVPVLIFEAPDKATKNYLKLHFSGNALNQYKVVKGDPLNGSIIPPSPPDAKIGKMCEIAVVTIEDMKTAGACWDNSTKVTTSNGRNEYLIVYAHQNIPATAASKQQQLRPTMEEATYIRFLILYDD